MPEGKDAGEGNRSDDAAEEKDTHARDAAEEKDTHARDDVLKDMLKEERFNINTTHCSGGFSALMFALGGPGEEHDALAVKRALAAFGVDVTVTDGAGCTALCFQCSWGRSRNVKLLLADPRVDVNLRVNVAHAEQGWVHRAVAPVLRRK